MTTIITRDQMRPGQIVARTTRQYYRVRPDKWPGDSGSPRAGKLKLTELGMSETTWEVECPRWKVYYSPVFCCWMVYLTPGSIWDQHYFPSHAEAIAWADKMARGQQ